MTSQITIEDVMTDSAAFGDLFSGESWAAWRAVLKAAYALPLSAEERSIFDGVSGGREPPKQRVRELWLIVGRRGGKDSVASLIEPLLQALKRHTLAGFAQANWRLSRV